MNDPQYNQWQEAGWRRALSPRDEAELRAWLEMHPDARADWALENGLNEALRAIPDAPVSSNFTARVVDAVARDGARAHRAGWRWSWRSLLPKAAVASAVLAVGGFSWHHHEATQRAEQAHYIAAVSQMAALPDPEVLQDFDAIQKMSQSQTPDEELLALMR